MGKEPGFYFYTGDWLKDTRVLKPEARGCWIDWLCVLKEKGGEVTWPIEVFGQYCGVTEETAAHVLNQLKVTGVADVEFDESQNPRKSIATLRNRRTIREMKKRQEIKELRSKAGKKGNEVRWQKSHSSSSSSSSLNINKTPKSPKGTEARFEEFWKEYPRKVGKGAAEKIWAKINPDSELAGRMILAVCAQRSWSAWTKDNGDFIPHPATWLNQKRWEDEQQKLPKKKVKPPVEPERPPEMTNEQIARNKAFLSDIAKKIG